MHLRSPDEASRTVDIPSTLQTGGGAVHQCLGGVQAWMLYTESPADLSAILKQLRLCENKCVLSDTTKEVVTCYRDKELLLGRRPTVVNVMGVK